jgi:hypothetical protein
MNKIDITKQIQVLMNNFNSRNFDYVISKSSIYLKKFPGYVILYNLLGSSHQSNGNYKKALKIFQEGLKYDPKNIDLINNLGTSYKNLLQYDIAEKLYTDAININPKYVNAYVNLGNLKRDINKLDEAIILYEKARQIAPQNIIILYLLSLANQGLGNFVDTIKFAKMCLDNNSKFTKADHLIAQSMKYEKEDSHYLSMIDKFNNSNLEDMEKIDLLFALAKANEDMEKVEDSFQFLKKGNNLKKYTLNYKVVNDTNLIEKIIEVFKDINFKEFKNKESSNLIFILGMPRSGTSLVEQIITSHSKVYGGGELPILSNLIKENLIENNEIHTNKTLELMKNYSKIKSISSEYYDYIKYFDYKEEFLTDKAPLNFRWIGFIKIFFPNAKIIHCKRDPKNNCLSLYKNFFEGGLNFTYSEKDLIKYYKSYSKLMDFWHSKEDNGILNINYEDLVNDKEQQIKTILEYCNLKWEDNCFNFHKNKNPIKTMSTAQARKPIYKSSLNSFEKYRNFLKDINSNL